MEEETLRKALTKAIIGKNKGSVDFTFEDTGIQAEVDFKGGSLFEFLEYKNWYSIIFDHDFAKAFWGRKPIRVHLMPDISVLDPLKDRPTADILSSQKEIEEWQWHLQQMALEKNPLDYIAKFV